MLVIRLQRTGRRKRTQFRVVLQEASKAPKSMAQEILGSYDPHAKTREEQLTLKADRITYWISKGAQPSNTVHNMLVELGIIEGTKKRSVQPKKKAGAEGEGEAAADAPADAPAKEAAAK